MPPNPTPDSGVDIGDLDPRAGELLRVRGSTGSGELGAPVAAGGDCDGDGLPDVALASFLASPLGRDAAGEVYLVFGDGTISGEIDTATMSSRVLKIAGAGTSETT